MEGANHRLPPWEPCQSLTWGKVSQGLTVMDKSCTWAGYTAHLVLAAPAAIEKDIGVCWRSPLTACLWLTWASSATNRTVSLHDFKVLHCPSPCGWAAGTAPLLPSWKREVDETGLGAAEVIGWLLTCSWGNYLLWGSRGILETGKGQLFSSGDAGLGMWKRRRFPAVLLPSASPRNKAGLVTVMKFKLWNIEHYLREYLWDYHLFVFLLATLALIKMEIIWRSGLFIV